MASAELIVHRYALALHALAGQADVRGPVAGQLADLDAVFAENPELMRQLAHPRVGRQVKRAVLTGLLGDAVCDVLRRTALLMVDKGRAGELHLLHGEYTKISMAAEGRAVARVQTAARLDDGTREQLVEQLSVVTGKQVSLTETVDESLLGGLRVIIGSRMIDGSLRRRLEMLQHKMLAAPLVAGDR